MGRALSWFLLAALLLTLSASQAIPSAAEENEENGLWAEEETESGFSLRRLLRHRNRHGAMTCDRNPEVCRVPGSTGRNCCRKRCVNLRSDVFNCGRCGRRCSYAEACCRGKCVNVLFDRRNCGACSRRCRKRSKCLYGMCNYA